MPPFKPGPESNETPSVAESSQGGRARSPWLIVSLGGIIALAVVVVCGIVLKQLSDESPTAAFKHKATLPDGSILVVEAVTFGTTHDCPLSLTPPEDSSRRHVIDSVDRGTSEERMVVFMRHLNADTGEELDFEWWGSSSAVDAFGSEVPDRDAMQQVVYLTDMWEDKSSRPLPPPQATRRFDGSNPQCAVVASSEFPLFRVDDSTFHLIVRNVDGKTVAEFDLPYTGPKVTDVWTSEPLPQTQSADGFSCTLSEVTADMDFSTYSNDEQPFRFTLNVITEWSYDGVPLSDPGSKISITDAAGNIGTLYDADLAWGEPAWEVRLANEAYMAPIGRSETRLVLPAPDEVLPVEIPFKQGVWVRTLDSLGGSRATHELWPGAKVVGNGNTVEIQLASSLRTDHSLPIADNTFVLVARETPEIEFATRYEELSFEFLEIRTPAGELIPMEVTSHEFVEVVTFAPPEGVTEVIVSHLVWKPLPDLTFVIEPPECPSLPTATKVEELNRAKPRSSRSLSLPPGSLPALFP